MALTWLDIDLTDDDDWPRGDPQDAIELPDLLELLARPAWHAEAACRGQGTRAWFPVRGESVDAVCAVCAGCPVREPCLAAGLAQPTWADAGIWGGTSSRARGRLRATMPSAPSAPRLERCAHCGGTFDAALRQARYCSPRCQQKAWKAAHPGHSRDTRRPETVRTSER